MGVDWPVIQLGQATTSVTKGTTPRQGEVDTSALEANFLRAETISEDGRLLHEKFQRIDFLTYERYARSRLHENDVLFTIAGAIGRVGIADASILPANINQAIALIRVDSAMLDYRFLSYVLRSDVVQRHATSRVVQSVQANFSLGELKTLEIPLPPLREQQAIADVLGALDDKIELNRKMNETLDELARTIFRSWFVDFDPVRAKMEGGEPFGMDAETAALFPDRLVDSPMGPIPEGWEVSTLGDMATFNTANVKPQDYPETEFAHYSIPAYDAGEVPELTLGTNIKSGKYTVPDNAVLLSKLNPRIRRVWLPSESNPDEAARIASTEFLVLTPKEGLPRSLVMATVSDANFLDRFGSLASGTSNSHQRVRPKDARGMDIVLPERPIISAFADQADPMLELMLANRAESQTLARLRDTLLPELISGRIRVPEAARLVGEAV